MDLKKIFTLITCLLSSLLVNAIEINQSNVSALISLKVPGNDAIHYPLALHEMSNGGFDYQLISDTDIPVTLFQNIENISGNKRITLFIFASEDIYFNYGELLKTDARHDDCLFYMPGFWYRKNLRSPKDAPSFHTSDSWIVREDRLSTPLTSIFDKTNSKQYSVIRIDSFKYDAFTSHKEGEVILSGRTSIGYTGFENVDGKAASDEWSLSDQCSNASFQ